jgi:hypothetical protein
MAGDTITCDTRHPFTLALPSEMQEFLIDIAQRFQQLRGYPALLK